MSKVAITRTTPLFPDGVFVQWAIASDEDGAHYIDVERSGGPAGPWEGLVTGLRDAYNYHDDLTRQPATQPSGGRTELNQLTLARAIYYRVTAMPPSGVAFSSEPTLVEPHLDQRNKLLKRKILRDQAVGYRRLNGIPIIVLKRRRWGDRCPVCYDVVTKQATIEHCTSCYSTSFVGGYWAPILIRGRREATAVDINLTSHGDTDTVQASFNLLDYPMVEYKDVLVDLVRNDRYEVQRVHETELQSVPVHQKVVASCLSRSSIEYLIPVDPTTTPKLY